MNLFSIILLGVIFIYLIFSLVYIYKNKKRVEVAMGIVVLALKVVSRNLIYFLTEILH